jgi:hypothetical protein
MLRPLVNLLRFRDEAGNVTEVTVTSSRPRLPAELERCVRQAILSMRMPAPPCRRTVHVTYSVIFEWVTM